MRLVALLNWYDESPAWLAATVASLTQAGVDHLVAVDGAYMLYPGALRRPFSNHQQVEAVTHTAYGAGIGVTLHQRREPWGGNEVEKRNFMFELARTFATEGEDWLLILDSDELIVRSAFDLKTQLATTDLNVATYLLRESGTGWTNNVRGLMRSLPGLRVEGAHYIYKWDGGCLWGRNDIHEHEEAFDATGLLVVEHRHDERPGERNQAAQSYYTLRDSVGAERLFTYQMETPDGDLRDL